MLCLSSASASGNNVSVVWNAAIISPGNNILNAPRYWGSISGETSTVTNFPNVISSNSSYFGYELSTGTIGYKYSALLLLESFGIKASSIEIYVLSIGTVTSGNVSRVLLLYTDGTYVILSNNMNDATKIVALDSNKTVKGLVAETNCYDEGDETVIKVFERRVINYAKFT